MMFWSDHMSGWGYAGMGLGMVLFWVLVIVGIIALVRYTGGGPSTARPAQPSLYSGRESPEQMLAGRFARGEIDETEYRTRLAVLRDTAQRPRSA